MPIVANAREFRLHSRGQYKELYINNIGVKNILAIKSLQRTISRPLKDVERFEFVCIKIYKLYIN